jgi:2-(3-amino-3-carboxypropyl)histidine synthase
MKTPILYIPAIQKNLNIKLPQSQISKLPKTLFLAYSIQYKTLAKSIKKQLQAHKIKIQKFQQVLGCSKISTNLPILLISTGKFHAQNLFLQTPILYVLENNKIIKIPDKNINKLKAKKKTALIKFLKADKIGILVSTKPGQENLNKAVKLKQKLEKKHKQPYIFISNHINISQFENFNVDSWVNTACSGITIDNPDIINIDELP